jgi:hypothetical protein
MIEFLNLFIIVLLFRCFELFVNLRGELSPGGLLKSSGFLKKFSNRIFGGDESSRTGPQASSLAAMATEKFVLQSDHRFSDLFTSQRSGGM